MRHRQRHLHETIRRYVQGELDALGWMDTPAPFGTQPVAVVGDSPLEAGDTPELNTVAVTIGHQGQDEPVELGGGLYRCDYTVFVDVWGATQSIGVAIADDIKQALVERIVPLRDFTTDAAGEITDARIEFEFTVVETIATATTTLDKRSWRAVKTTARCYF